MRSPSCEIAGGFNHARIARTPRVTSAIYVESRKLAHTTELTSLKDIKVETELCAPPEPIPKRASRLISNVIEVKKDLSQLNFFRV